MQALDAVLVAMHSHGDHAEQLGKLLALKTLTIIKKGLCLHQRILHHIRIAMAGADQAGDGGVPAELASVPSIGSIFRAAA